MMTPQHQNQPRQAQPATASGFSLIELLIAIAILSVITAIGLPMYRGYIETSQNGVLINNLATIEMFQEDFRLRNGSYAVNLADKAAITAAIDWDPRDSAEYTYSIANSDGTFYRVTASDGEGNTVCLEFPAKVACP